MIEVSATSGMRALDRPFQAMRRLMQPRSIAVIGASADVQKFSGRPLAYLARLGYRGSVYPVTPHAQRIEGFRCFRRLVDVPETVDAVLVARPAEEAVGAVAEALSLGVRAFVVFGGGFAEAGPEGADLQQRLADMCRAAGAVLCGPNCTGLAHFPSRAAMSFMSNLDREVGDGGTVAVVSNSGSIAAMLVQDRGRLVDSVVSTGNEAVTTSADYIAWAIEDPKVRGVVAFVESIRDADGFIAAASRAAELGKPVAVLKAGRSAAAAAVAASHTAAMVDDDAVVDAALRVHGVVRVRTLEELKAAATLIHARSRWRFGSRLGVVTPSGGTSVLIADEAAERGLSLPALAPDTMRALRESAPKSSPGNPMDVTGFAADPASVRRVAATVLGDPGIDVLLVPMGGAVGATAEGRAEALIALAGETDKAVVPVWQATTRGQAGYDRLLEAGLPVFTDYSLACAALGHLAAFDAFAASRAAGATRPGAAASTDEVDPGEALRSALELAASAGRWLSEPEVKALLAAAGVAVPRGRVVGLDATRGELEAAASLGCPLMLKIVSRSIVHKSRVGGVAEVRASDALAEQVQALVARVRGHLPDVQLEGVLVEEAVVGGTELFAGIRVDPKFGATLTLGVGGLLAEAFAPVTGLLPRSRAEAAALCARLSRRLAEGPAGAALADFAVRISRVARSIGARLQVLEVNPVKLVDAAGVPVLIALDGVIELSPDPTKELP